MQPISLISWESHWEVRTRWAINCFFVIAVISLLLTVIFIKSLLFLIILLLSIVIIFLFLLGCHWLSRLYVKSHQSIHIFTNQTVTVITKNYRLLPTLFKRTLGEKESISSHQESQLKYLTSRTIKENYPNFLGLPINGKLLTITWTYSERNELKYITLKNIRMEDWQREEEAILKWVNDARKDIGNYGHKGV